MNYMFTFNDNRKWTKAEKEQVVNLKTKYPYFTFKEIADELIAMGYPKRTPKAVQGIWRRFKNNSKAYSKPQVKATVKTLDKLSKLLKTDIDSTPSVYKEALEDMSNMRERAVTEHNKVNIKIGNPINPNVKVVSISDLHIPFFNEYVIQKVLDEAPDTDILVVNGDFLEAYSVSSWPKNKTIMLRHEYEMGMKLLREFARVFPKVILTKGNHENRLTRYFSQNISNNVSFLVSSDLLDKMAKGYDFNDSGELEQMYNLDNVFYNKGPLSWQVQVGKCIFAHPTSYSKISMKTACNVAQTMAGKGIDFEALVIAHTHQQGSCIRDNRLIIEQGCACIPMEYEADAKATYTGASFGYAVIYMDNDGHVDFDKSRTVYCGTGAIVEPNNVYSVED